jgi:hypothetical protein
MQVGRGGTSEIDIALPAERIAFLAYNIGVFESVQKFGGLITSGKITSEMDVSKVAELLSESKAFYDAQMISDLVNALSKDMNSTIDRISPSQVEYVMKLLKTTGVQLP